VSELPAKVTNRKESFYAYISRIESNVFIILHAVIKNIGCVRFQVLTAASMKLTAFLA
jgi:hypothetical protein